MLHLFLKQFAAIIVILFISGKTLGGQVKVMPKRVEDLLDNCYELDGVFCVNSTNYPTDAIHQAIRKDYDIFKYFFDTKDESSSTATRFDYGVGEKSMCEITTRMIYPQIAYNADNDKYRIVNDKVYKQGVRVVNCEEINKPCKNVIANNLPNGYETTCRQRKTKTTLLGVKDSSLTGPIQNLEIKATLFEVPSCCECVLLSNRDDGF